MEYREAGMNTWHIEYRFTSASGKTAVFPLDFDAESMQPLNTARPSAPDWTALDAHRCTHCPLHAESAPQCPAALRLADLLDWCSGLDSFEPMELTVITSERAITAKTTAQRAISSLMGLLLATSGCPETAFLRPMARFHLPLASELETVYRAVSMYLLAQFFIERKGVPADFDLEGLRQRYQGLRQVNLGLCKRLRQAASSDSSPNAIVLLDCFAQALPDMIDNALSELEPLFAPYLK
jgi:hypothetical protein